MSILNVDKIQPIGGGSTITVDATDIQATSATITASKFVGSGDLSVTGVSTTNTLHVAANNTTVGVAITQSGSGDILKLYDGTSEVFTVANQDDGVGAVTISSPKPRIVFNETNGSPDYQIRMNGGIFSIHDSTNDIGRISITSTRTDINNPVLLNNDTVWIGDKLVHWTDDDTAIRFPSANTISMETAGSERIRIDSSGNVMIGLTSSSNKFHVEGTTTGSRFGVDVSSSGITALAVTNESNADIETVIFDGRSSIGSSVNIPIAFHTNGKTNEKARLTTSGEVLVGMSNSQAVAGGSAKIQVQSIDSTGRISIVQHRNEASGAPFLSLGKTRATAVNNATLVQDGDTIGTIAFAGGDGTDVQSVAAQIECKISSTAAANDMPGSLGIFTTPDGTATPKKRINLTHKGEFQISNQLGSGNIINQISRAEGNTTETFTLSQLGLDDNNYVMIWIVASGTGVRDYGHSLITWLQPLGNNSSINTQIDAMGSGSGVSTFTQAVNGNDLVVTKDSDLALNVTVIGAGGRRTSIGWG